MIGSFWWKANLKLIDQFKSMARCHLGDGKYALHIICMHHSLPHLFSFAKNTQITIFETLQTEFLEDLFHLPLTVQAYDQFLQFESLCDEQRNLNLADCNDTWS